MIYGHSNDRPPMANIGAAPYDWGEFDRQRQQDRAVWRAGALSVVLALAGAVWMFIRARRRPAHLARAEATLAGTASRAEQAARTVRKHGPAWVERGGAQIEHWGRMLRKRGPGMLARGAARVEQGARNVRKQAPALVAHSAGRAEQAARTVRKRGPARLRAGYYQTEQAIERTRDFGAELGAQAGQALDRSRAAGETVAGAAQRIGQRVRARLHSDE